MLKSLWALQSMDLSGGKRRLQSMDLSCGKLRLQSMNLRGGQRCSFPKSC